MAVRGDARRDEIVDLFWRDVEEAKARNAFRQALHRLRSALGEALIPQEREHLRLAASAELAIDFREFEAAIAAGRVDDAVQLYRGEFLQGVELGEPAFDLWADSERNRFRAQFRGALEAAIASNQADGAWTEAIALARRLLELAPLDEQAARAAATALISAGRRTEARDVLLQFGARLHAELGVAAPAEVQALLARLEKLGDAAPARGPATESPAFPFAGREAELSQLLALWRVTGDDSGTIALIEGEAGIGKTRLVHELVAHARSLGRATVLRAREHPGTAGVPFALFADALRPLVRAAGVAGASRHLLAEAARLLPELRDTFDLPPIATIEDEAARVRFFEGVAALVDAAAYEQPVLLVLEDLHHTGPSTLDLLAYLCGRLAGSAVMIVLTARAAEAPAAVVGRLRALAGGAEAAGMRAGGRARVVALPRIGRPAALEMLRAAAGAARLAEDVVARIADRADGVPSRHAELLRRALAGEDVTQLPVALRSLVEERLRGLSSSHRRAFLALALLGRPVGQATLADIAHLAEGAIPETVAALEEHGLVVVRDGACEPDTLASEVALAAAGHASRAFLAGWIADALSADPSSAPSELAKFHALAGRPREAFGASRRAAFAALGIGGWAEAVQHAQVARSFAATPEEAAELESLLAALGAGNVRLAAASAQAPAPAPALDGPRENVAVEPPPRVGPTLWERWFPNWRVLFGAAVATLLISALVMWQAPQPLAASLSDADTLVVVESGNGRSVRYVTGNTVSGFVVSRPLDVPGGRLAWTDSLDRQWTGPVADPRGMMVALTRHSEQARSGVYIVLANRGDTLQVWSDVSDARVLGWSPDGRWLLVTTSEPGAGSVDADLYAVRADGGARIPLDTAAHRSVVEAAWSPDGSRIAWVARVGDERQQEVLMSLADGSGTENLTRHPADDYHIAWSSDGGLLGFTSMRDGNAELYALSLPERRLWRLTRDPAQDDFARFSPSGRLVAFESTRGGEAGVYLMPALGGEPWLVGGGLPLSVREWRGGEPRHIQHLRIDHAEVPEVGDTTPVRLLVVDQYGDPIVAPFVRVWVLDSAVATVFGDEASGGYRVIGRRAGLARVVADAGRWRADTTLLRVGLAPVVVAEGVPSPAGWRALGVPRPRFEDDGASLDADRDWESGILSLEALPLGPGLVVSVRLREGFADLPASSTIGVALVAPEQSATLDTIAPQFLRHASLTWDADARRLIYAAGREVFSERVSLSEGAAGALLELRVERDSTVSMSIGGRRRWQSTLKVVNARVDPRAQVWIGGRSTGPLRVAMASVSLARVSSP